MSAFTYFPRVFWDDSGLPRLGYPVPRSKRTELWVHHTVTIDPDPTPVVWETLAEVKQHMKRLQTIRPDLGLDVPYNFVAFIMPDDLVIMEGRGFDLTGAHTQGHNTVGLATSFAGNFQDYPVPAGTIDRLNAWFRFQKEQAPNLGPIFGHRDAAQTACPGNYLYATKPLWTWAAETEDDMTPEQDERLKRIEELLGTKADLTTGPQTIAAYMNASDDYLLKAMAAALREAADRLEQGLP